MSKERRGRLPYVAEAGSTGKTLSRLVTRLELKGYGRDGGYVTVTDFHTGDDMYTLMRVGPEAWVRWVGRVQGPLSAENTAGVWLTITDYSDGRRPVRPPEGVPVRPSPAHRWDIDGRTWVPGPGAEVGAETETEAGAEREVRGTRRPRDRQRSGGRDRRSPPDTLRSPVTSVRLSALITVADRALADDPRRTYLSSELAEAVAGLGVAMTREAVTKLLRRVDVFVDVSRDERVYVWRANAHRTYSLPRRARTWRDLPSGGATPRARGAPRAWLERARPRDGDDTGDDTGDGDTDTYVADRTHTETRTETETETETRTEEMT